MTDVATVPQAANLTVETINSWADGLNGPVALSLIQELLPVGGNRIIFPPTYADIGYNITVLSDGTKIASIDSVGSQGNRMEPLFGVPPYSELVPQIEIEIYRKKESNEEEYVEIKSILDLAHRSADAVVLASDLAVDISAAFRALRRTGDAWPLARLAPTSLVFGVWDSRGGSGEKRPRIVRSVITAHDVDVVSGAAQFNSVWKALSNEQKEELKKSIKKEENLSTAGLADAPAVFRKLKGAADRDVPPFLNGAPNPARRVLGGVIVQGAIQREVTINLVALRAIGGSDDESGRMLRHYLLGLSLIAATADQELYLREGCMLRYASEDHWKVEPRRGEPTDIDLASPEARQLILKYADAAAEPFKKTWPEKLRYRFDIKEAKKLATKVDDEDGREG